MKEIIITSGGTEEYIDDVRVLTNISSGKLGSRIAEVLSVRTDLKIHFVRSRRSHLPEVNTDNIMTHDVRTATDAFKKIEYLMCHNKIDAVIHSMAVSDFTFRRDKPVKLKSNDPESFIDYMRETITPNPKIISFIKKWNPNTFLIGFKFEVGISTAALVKLACSSIIKNDCDLVVANDKKEMEQAKSHVGHFIFSQETIDKYHFEDFDAVDKETIAQELGRIIRVVLELR